MISFAPSRSMRETAITLFSLVFYGVFARFREQACTFICPYGRFQSTILDENTMVVAYDYKRGEKRAPLHRGQSFENRQAEGLGDCISCYQCVAVCPTGIDIRKGLQYECIACAACVDACDSVMDKMNYPRGLIRYSRGRITVTDRAGLEAASCECYIAATRSYEKGMAGSGPVTS